MFFYYDMQMVSLKSRDGVIDMSLICQQSVFLFVVPSGSNELFLYCTALTLVMYKYPPWTPNTTMAHTTQLS